MFSSIIKRGILSEIIPAFIINLLVFTFILLMARVMSLADLVVRGGVSSRDIAWIFLLVLPKMLSMSIPMSALLAPLTTFLRMSADSEITVLKASGISLYQLLSPVLLFGLTACLITGFFNVYLTPLANLRFRTEILILAKARADLAIKEQVFVRDFPGLVIYVGQLRSAKDNMANIVINDRRLPGENTFIVAEEGLLDIDHQGGLLLFRLINGVIDRMHENSRSVDSIFFDTYELKISPGPEFDTEENSLVLGYSELPTNLLLPEAARLKGIENPTAIHYELEYHRRFAFPVAAFLMALIGMPLGASFRTRGRNFGLIIAIIIFVLYYSAFTLGLSLGAALVVRPFAAVWSSNFLAAITAALLLKNINRSAAIDPQAAFKRFKRRFFSKKEEAGDEGASGDAGVSGSSGASGSSGTPGPSGSPGRDEGGTGA
jgi:lipopolysaccharide export system permease protein